MLFVLAIHDAYGFFNNFPMVKRVVNNEKVRVIQFYFRLTWAVRTDKNVHAQIIQRKGVRVCCIDWVNDFVICHLVCLH